MYQILNLLCLKGMLKSYERFTFIRRRGWPLPECVSTSDIYQETQNVAIMHTQAYKQTDMNHTVVFYLPVFMLET